MSSYYSTMTEEISSWVEDCYTPHARVLQHTKYSYKIDDKNVKSDLGICKNASLKYSYINKHSNQQYIKYVIRVLDKQVWILYICI